MKFLHSNEKPSKDTIVLSFFFNARGEKLEKSTEGLYRSLLFQLMTQAPDLQPVLDHAVLLKNHIGVCWPLESLKELIEEAMRYLDSRALVLFIDALDECDDEEVREMVGFFENLGDSAVEKRNRLRICLSSRHYPNITVRYGLSVILEKQQEHQHDIESYIYSELCIGNSERAEKIRKRVQEKASGIFLWVVLVVPMLNKSFDRGQMTNMEELLDDIPTKLEELFHSILSRDSDQRRQPREQRQTDLCLKWVLYALKPLTLKELYFAILAGTDDDTSPEWIMGELDDEVISRFILDCSRGLVEGTRTTDRIAQFIHESVREYFLYGVSFGEDDYQDPKIRRGRSNEQLKQCCHLYLRKCFMKAPLILATETSLPRANTREADKLRQLLNPKFPFMVYAIQRILYHSNTASASGILQFEFLQKFNFRFWVFYSNVFEKYEIRRYETAINLLYILTDLDLTALLRESIGLYESIEIGGGRYGIPLLAARANHSSDAITVLLSPQDQNGTMSSGSSASPSAEDYQKAASELFENQRWSYFSSKRGDRMLNFAFSSGCFALAKCLIASNRILLENPTCERQNSQRSPLEEAIFADQADIIRMLMPKYPDLRPETVQNLLCNALSYASENALRAFLDSGIRLGLQCAFFTLLCVAQKGYEQVAKMLISTGAPLTNGTRCKPCYKCSPLYIASAAGHMNIVQMLIDKSSETCDEVFPHHKRATLMDAIRCDRVSLVSTLLKSGFGLDTTNVLTTALCLAVEWTRDPLIKVLLEAGADPNQISTRGDLPLLQATKTNKIDIINILLNAGAKVSASTRLDQPPLLHVACYHKNPEIFELLVKRGADVNHFNTEWPPVLFSAIAAMNLSILRIVLENGADPNTKLHVHGKIITPLEFMNERNWTSNEARDLLLAHEKRRDSLPGTLF